MGTTNVNAAIQLQITKDGDTLGGCLLVLGILDQQRNKDSGAFVPDYSISANNVTLFPRITSSLRGGTIAGIANFSAVKWYFNGVEITASTPSFSLTTYLTGSDQVPALKIIGNPTTTDGSFELRFEADVNNGSSISRIVITTSYSLSTLSTAAWKVTLATSNGGIVNATGAVSCVLTPKVLFGASAISTGIFYKYKKMKSDGTWEDFGSNTTSRPSVTVTTADVDGSDIFKVEVYKGSASGELLCTDVQEVIDDSDPYSIVATTQRFYYNCPAQTVTPKVFRAAIEQSGWSITSIRLIFSDGSVKKTSTTGSIQLTWDDVKGDTGIPYLYVSAQKS